MRSISVAYRPVEGSYIDQVINTAQNSLQLWLTAATSLRRKLAESALAERVGLREIGIVDGSPSPPGVFAIVIELVFGLPVVPNGQVYNIRLVCEWNVAAKTLNGSLHHLEQDKSYRWAEIKGETLFEAFRELVIWLLGVRLSHTVEQMLQAARENQELLDTSRALQGAPRARAN